VDTRINGNQHRKHRIRTQCILYVCNFTSNNKRIDHTFFDINFFPSSVEENSDKNISLDTSKNDDLKEWLGNFFIFIFSVISFTVRWDFITYQDSRILDKNVVLTLVNLVAASFLFFIFYLPSKMIFLLEEWALIELNEIQDKNLIYSYIFPLIIAIWQVW